MKLFIVANNIPDTVQKMFEELEKDDITYLEVNSKVPKKLKTQTLFILTYTDFHKNLARLNSEEYLRKNVVLFAPIIKVKYLKPAHFLDVKSDKGMFSINSEYKNLCVEVLETKLNKPFSKKKVAEEDIEFKYLLVEGVRAGSLLNPLMTLLYSVKAESSIRIKEMILCWLVSKEKIEDLKKKLKNSYEWGSVSSKFCTTLLNLLSSELGIKYKEALSKIETLKEEGEKHNTAAVAKKYAIDEYELKYILSNLVSVRKHALDGKTVNQVYEKQKKKSAEKERLAEEAAAKEERLKKKALKKKLKEEGEKRDAAEAEATAAKVKPKKKSKSK